MYYIVVDAIREGIGAGKWKSLFMKEVKLRFIVAVGIEIVREGE